MTTPFNPNVISDMGFTPLDLVDITIGRVTAKVYPKITPTMQIFDHAHAWQINKTALYNLPADFKLIIDAFGAQLNATSTVKGIMSGWKRFFSDHWYNFNHLMIMSFHNLEGRVINDTTTVATPRSSCPCRMGSSPPVSRGMSSSSGCNASLILPPSSWLGRTPLAQSFVRPITLSSPKKLARWSTVIMGITL
jgi:hypothetical protein